LQGQVVIFHTAKAYSAGEKAVEIRPVYPLVFRRCFNRLLKHFDSRLGISGFNIGRTQKGLNFGVKIAVFFAAVFEGLP
jgi:hypothetical protein